MPIVDSSHWTSNAARTRVATVAASWSPVTAEMVLRATPGPLFEFACHEGNYSLTSILAAARQGNQPPPRVP